MGYLKILAWGVLAIAVVAGIAAALYVHQARRPPVTNSWYVALGSSYAAGLGLGPRAPGSPIISARSTNGYPPQLARLLKAPSFTDMSSSGSTVRHVLHGGQMLLGPQIDALGPDTKLVTLTAGGNDVGYVGDLMAMAYRNQGGIIGKLIGLFWKGAKPADARDFAALDETLQATLHEIAHRSPQARIVVVTYPTALPSKGTCPALGLSEEQTKLMHAVQEKLAETTRHATASAGATLVDMAALSSGHDACSDSPWVNGFKPKTGTSFHPTLAGATATAHAIAKAVEASEARALLLDSAEDKSL